MRKKKLVVLSGAGISQESGISTFRDANGLWENHDIMEVASIQGWNKNPALVLNFYNQRRRQLAEVYPNDAHRITVDLESKYDVFVITQNVDDLHQRAGSSNILHLHGELYKACSTKDKSIVVEWKNDIAIEDRAPDHAPLRPFIVWFGEDVPLFDDACKIIHEADILVVIGTSLQVYPAAQLIHEAHHATLKFIIDPRCTAYHVPKDFIQIPMKATAGMQRLWDILLSEEVKE